MTKEEFIKNIKITDEEKKKAEYYLKYRGIEAHEKIHKFLNSLTGDVISYSAIATAFRYDKRIRRILYKYIGFLEEMVRAYIANIYNKKIYILDRIRKKPIEINQRTSLFEGLCELTFSELIMQIDKLSDYDKRELFPCYNTEKELKKDLHALVVLRNEVSHNRFLLDYKRLSECSVGDGNNSLWANIINLGKLLPMHMRTNYLTEIKEAQKLSNNIYENQTEWELLPQIIISLDDNCF